MWGFPRIIGAADCTQVPIQSPTRADPGGDDGEIYHNCSINKLYKFIYAYFMLTASTAYNMQSCKAASNKVIAKSICDKQLTIK